MLNRLDIVIFGATGFTGKRIIPELSRLLKLEQLPLKWGVAARSEKKLREILKVAEKKYGDDFSEIPVIIADVTNEESLLRMTAQTRVIVNTVGPFRFYGEAVIKACMETCTHHIDVSGEPGFMEKIQLKYHEEALRKSVYLLNACGLDSIPADMGAIFLSKNFVGTLNSIETFLYGGEEEKYHAGPVLNYTTWESAVYGIANYKELIDIRAKLIKAKLPQCKPKLNRKGNLFKNEAIGKWAIPFVGADRSIMLRTQRYLYELYRQRPVQIQSYIAFEKLQNALLAVFFGKIFQKMSQYEWTRSLLLKHPRIFSFGTFTLGGPSEEKQENTKFYIILEGEGWDEEQPDPTHKFKSLPNKKMVVVVSGKSPGYGTTSITLSLAAITLLIESEKLPNKGGCYPPGAAFANTSLIEKLQKYGIKFELKSKL